MLDSSAMLRQRGGRALHCATYALWQRGEEGNLELLAAGPDACLHLLNTRSASEWDDRRRRFLHDNFPECQEMLVANLFQIFVDVSGCRGWRLMSSPSGCHP